jgi:N-acyl homoserine lactone hydrolase
MTTTATKMWALDGPTMTLHSGMIMVGGNETITFPLPAYLIQHARGLVLFDTGLAPQAQKDPVAVYGEIAEHVNIRFAEEQRLENQLALVGFRPSDVTHVVVSHTHLDHTGGLPMFQHAKLYAGDGDLRYALWPDEPDSGFFHRPDIEAMRGCRWNNVRGDLDLFGDGSIVLLAMPGHTPGNQSLLVRLPSQTFLLTGDTVHVRAALDVGLPMGADHDTQQAKQSIRRLRQLRDSLDATVWISHDPEDSAMFKFAPYVYE